MSQYSSEWSKPNHEYKLFRKSGHKNDRYKSNMNLFKGKNDYILMNKRLKKRKMI